MPVLWRIRAATSTSFKDFDSAMKSRCHLALQFDAPTREIRKEIWRSQLEAIPVDEKEIDMSSVLELLADENMNGREISNSINTARTLARHSKEKLQLKHLQTVSDVWQQFNIDLRKLSQRRRTEPRQDSFVIMPKRRPLTGEREEDPDIEG